MARARREDTKWALVEDGQFFDDDDGVILFETRLEARKWQRLWVAVYKRLEANRQPPKVVKVRVRVEEVIDDD